MHYKLWHNGICLFESEKKSEIRQSMEYLFNQQLRSNTRTYLTLDLTDDEGNIIEWEKTIVSKCKIKIKGVC